MTRGGCSARIVPISGTVTWKSDRISSRYASNSSSARSISSMSSTGGDAVVALERLEQRAADQEVGPEDVVGAGVLGLAARLQQPDLEHLARVVPLVDRGVDVEALVALEPDEPRAERRGEDLGELGLADAGLALEQQRPAELERQEDRRRERAVGDVVALAEGGLEASMERVPAGRSSRSVIGRIVHARRPAGVDRPGGDARFRWFRPGRDPRHARAAPSSASSPIDGRQARPSLRAACSAARSSAAALSVYGPVQLADPVREAGPHLALDLVEQRGEAAVRLEADLLDELREERPRLLAPIGELTLRSLSTSLPPNGARRPARPGPRSRPRAASRACPASRPRPSRR